ncbi:hypothetical protein M0638_20905 [Roseomonas sp. NAR14]|uniref:Uncharacterized protein n=1 Tax=Roseomonas acroporae TaxID=2937791 RepID=A0A9X2BX53_9PROT|nr:hypothetical protein [Roseomonas acroporae]MCK8786836.1 hypothetical protein [Roseomonas acroporae]
MTARRLRPVPLAAGALALWILVPSILAPSAGRADFFDGARRTFQRDIPHFFQDDIPCAFGGRPTSGARSACRSGQQARQPATRPAGQPRPANPAERQPRP